MSRERKRDWSTRDFIQQAKERGHLPDVGADLNTQPTLPESDTKDPAYERGLFVGAFSERSLAEIKSAAYDEMMYQQWKDFQNALNDPDYVQKIPDRPQASYAMQDAFDKVMKMQKLDFPVVLLDVDRADDFQYYARQFLSPDPEFPIDTKENDKFQRDFIWVTWKLMKTWAFGKVLQRTRNSGGHFDPATLPDAVNEDGTSAEPSNNHWRDRFIDNIKEDYPDDYPCLVIFTRKAINFASISFVEGTNEPDANTPLGLMLTAFDARDYDPRIQAYVDNGSLRDDDGGLALTIPRSAIQRWIDEGPQNGGDPGQGGAGSGDPSDPFGCCDNGGSGDPPPVDPTDPGTGIEPPPSGGGIGAPGAGDGIRATWNCDTEIVFNEEGTNHTHALVDFGYNNQAAWFFTLGPGNLFPVNSMDILTANVKTAIDISIAAYASAHSIPSGYTVNKIVLCASFVRMKRAALLMDEQESMFTINFDNDTGNPFTGYTDPKPRLRVQRGSTGGDKILRGEVKRLGEYDFEVLGYAFQAVADVEVAEDTLVTINNYNTVTGVTFSCIMVPAIWNFFGASSTSPFIKLGLKSADIYFPVNNWTGHWKFNTIAANIHENPNIAGQNVWFSDTPDGLVHGQGVSASLQGSLWAGTEVNEPCVLINTSDPTGGRLQVLPVFAIADGYVYTPELNYTSLKIKLRYVGAAQTCTLAVHTHAGGPGDLYTFALPGTSTATTPFPFSEYETTIDVSASSITTATSFILVELQGGLYVNEFRVQFS